MEGFDTMGPGALPPGWECGVTGKGSPRWAVQADPAAPSKPNVLQQSGSGTFPWCVLGAASLENGHVEVKFSDTGRGMDLSRRASLLKGSLATRSTGHGLGFASVRRMVKGCGAALRISSEPGHGTTVLVAFPQSGSTPDDIVVDARLNMRPVHPG